MLIRKPEILHGGKPKRCLLLNRILSAESAGSDLLFESLIYYIIKIHASQECFSSFCLSTARRLRTLLFFSQNAGRILKKSLRAVTRCYFSKGLFYLIIQALDFGSPYFLVKVSVAVLPFIESTLKV